MRVKLKANHTHADLEYGPGDEIDLPEDSAQRLIDLGVAECATDESNPED